MKKMKKLAKLFLTKRLLRAIIKLYSSMNIYKLKSQVNPRRIIHEK